MQKLAYGIPPTPPSPGGVVAQTQPTAPKTVEPLSLDASDIPSPGRQAYIPPEPIPELKPQPKLRSTETPRTLSRFVPSWGSESESMLRDVLDQAPLPPPRPKPEPAPPKLPPMDVQLAREYEKLLNDPQAAADGRRTAFEESIGKPGIQSALQVLANEGSTRAGDKARRSGYFTPYSRDVEVTPFGHKTKVGPGFDIPLTYLAEGMSSLPRTAMRVAEAVRPGTVETLPGGNLFNSEAVDPLGGNAGLRAAIAKPYDPTINQTPTPFKLTSTDMGDAVTMGADAADAMLSALPGAGRLAGQGEKLLSRLPSVIGAQTGRVLADAATTGATQAGIDTANRAGYLNDDLSKSVAGVGGMMLGNAAGNKALGGLTKAPVVDPSSILTPRNTAAAAAAKAVGNSTSDAIRNAVVLPAAAGSALVAANTQRENNVMEPEAPKPPAPAAPAAPVATTPAAPVASAPPAPVPTAATKSVITPPAPVTTQPVAPLKNYWDSLGDDSKWLVRGGAGAAGLAALMAAMRGKSSDEEEEESGLGSYLTPLLGLGGLGAMAYGAGGGGLSALPSLSGMGDKYKQLGSAVMGQFTPAAK